MAVHAPLSHSRALPQGAGLGVHQDILLLLERPKKVGETEGETVIDTVSVFADESIADIKLRLRTKKQWFTNGHCLACGDRELLDHEIVGRVARTSADFLHVFVRLRDVHSLSARGRSRTSLDYFQPDKASPRSLLTASLTQGTAAQGSPAGELQPAGFKAAGETHNDHHDAVLHLVVRRGARVAWRSQDDEFELAVAGTETAEGVARRIEASNGLPASSHQLLYKGQVLSSNRPLASYGLGRGSLVDLQPVEPPLRGGSLPFGSPPLSSPEHGLHDKFQQARAGLAKGLSPSLATSGCGGSYFMPDDKGAKVAVFKPTDEEPLAANNPRESPNGVSASSDGYGLRKGICPGEGAFRELAAYVLDHNNFANVPATALVSCQGFDDQAVSEPSEGRASKLGSLQAFVTSDSDCEEQGCSAFPVQEVHKIAVLDIRLVNTDRNGSNILAKRWQDETVCSWVLTPIDHGYCLPGSLQDANFEWISWPQSAQPFDAATLAYIQSLDADKDLALLPAHNIHLRPECQRVFKVGTLVLKMGASRGCTAREIGCVMTRQDLHKSPIEKLHARTVDLALAGRASKRDLAHAHRAFRSSDSPMAVDLVPDEAYFHHLEEVLDEYFNEMLAEGR